MTPDRDYIVAKHEMERRHQEAAEERAIREARRAAREARNEQESDDKTSRGALGWLRRLAGVRQ